MLCANGTHHKKMQETIPVELVAEGALASE